MENVYEFLFQGWAQPREKGTYQTLHGLITRSGVNFIGAVAGMKELEARGSLTRQIAAGGPVVYLWATPVR